MDNQLAEKFGKLLVQHVRDYNISRFKRLIDESKIPSRFSDFQAAINSLDDSQREFAQYLIIVLVDSVIHDFLSVIESSDWITLGLKSEDTVIENLATFLPDDLRGYIFEWSEKYSRERIQK